MKKTKDSIISGKHTFGGFRAEAQEYNQIISDYMERLVVIKETNQKRKLTY